MKHKPHIAACLFLLATGTLADETPAPLVGFINTHCAECHNSEDVESGLDLVTLAKTPIADVDPVAFAVWVKVHDRIEAGEMPPDEPLETDVSEPFRRLLADELIRADQTRTVTQGRVVFRRMNRHEYENTLRDLLDAPWLRIKQMLPEDGEAYRFNKVGEALDTSHVQIARYMQAADSALRQIVVRSPHQPDATPRRFYAREQPSFKGRLRYNEFNRSPERAVFPLLDEEADLEVLNDEDAPASLVEKDPTRREREAFGVVAGAYEPLEPRFNQFTAPHSGRYRLRFSAYTFWAGPGKDKRWWRPDRGTASRGRRSEPVSIYAHAQPRLLRLLGGFDVHPEPSVQQLDVELVQGESIRPDPARLFRSRPSNWHNPLAERDGMPGVAYRWLEVEGPLHDSWPPTGHRLLFDQLPIQSNAGPEGSIVESKQPAEDAERLMTRFLKRAYRRPVADADVVPFTQLVRHALDTGSPFSEAMIAGYTAVLCSPKFVCFHEQPGPLDDHAVATRLSYFLVNSEPDAELRKLANSNSLRDLNVLRQQANRLLDSANSQRFVNAFLDYWLDLRHIEETSAHEFMYNDYYLDDLLVESALLETRTFFGDLIARNRPSSELIDSGAVFVNERLAKHYGIGGVEGIELRSVELPIDSPRGGLLTQASVLKVTADGTNTSPVKRGAWIMERILGQKPPPPPPSVPAIEPDTRGAKTIRQLLEKHRSDETCNACHRKIDPPGFALESFDVLGGWRTAYRTLGEDVGIPVAGFGKNGQPFQFRLGQPVDASGEWSRDRSFTNVNQFKALLLEDERQIARNLVRQLIIYSTGSSVRFGDRGEIERILDAAAVDNYGVRSILLEIVSSSLFLNK